MFYASAVLLLAGAALYLAVPVVAPWIFAAGAAGIAVCRLTQPVGKVSVRAKRLHMFNVAAALLMLVASVFMFRGENEWIACLSIAAVLQVYVVLIEN